MNFMNADELNRYVFICDDVHFDEDIMDDEDLYEFLLEEIRKDRYYEQLFHGDPRFTLNLDGKFVERKFRK